MEWVGKWGAARPPPGPRPGGVAGHPPTFTGEARPREPVPWVRSLPYCLGLVSGR